MAVITLPRDKRVAAARRAELGPVPMSDVREQAKSDDGYDREPSDARLRVVGDEERGEERAQGAAGVAADLKKRLRETVAATGSHARDPRGLRVKNGRAEPNQRARH